MPLSDKQREEIKLHFQANMLDGDDVNDCGGAMLSAESVLEYCIDLVDQELDRRTEVCRKIFIEEVDWSEWGISDKEAGENFDEALKLSLLTPSQE